MGAKYIIRFDDVCPGMAWSKFSPLKRALERLDVKSVLGVIPECRDESLYVEAPRDDFFDAVREWAAYGDAIAQHGTFHVYDSKSPGLLGINPRSEFAGYEYDVQLRRLAIGKEILRRERVWQPWFMAPAHSFDANTLDALRALGFEALTDGYGFYPYRLREILLVPQLAAHPLPLSFGWETICVHINTLSANAIDRLLAFVERRRASFVDFKEVVRMEIPDGILTKSTRALSEVVLKARRRLRH